MNTCIHLLLTALFRPSICKWVCEYTRFFFQTENVLVGIEGEQAAGARNALPGVRQNSERSNHRSQEGGDFSGEEASGSGKLNKSIV